MNSNWQFVLNQTSVEFLLACRGREREKLLRALRQIADDPLQRGDYNARDEVGRSVQIKLAEKFFITFWADVLVKELRVINIERV